MTVRDLPLIIGLIFLYHKKITSKTINAVLLFLPTAGYEYDPYPSLMVSVAIILVINNGFLYLSNLFIIFISQKENSHSYLKFHAPFNAIIRLLG